MFKSALISVLALVLVGMGTFIALRPAQTPPVGATPGGDFLNPVVFYSGATNSSVNATSTPASMTLRAADVQNRSTVVVTQTVSVGITLTTFASSTARGFLSSPGQWQDTCFLNATTTSGATITFAAGTGVNLYVASSTAGSGSLILNPGRTACFRIMREQLTSSKFDFSWLLTQYI